MENILVLGIGNQLMMDDGIGIYLVEELAIQNNLPNVQFIIGESDIDYCLEKIDGATFVIIIDAVSSGKNPGEISIYPLAKLDGNQPLNISPHNLHLFQVLYHQKERINGFLIGVEPFEIKFHIGLSSPIREKLSVILVDVKRHLEKLIK